MCERKRTLSPKNDRRENPAIAHHPFSVIRVVRELLPDRWQAEHRTKQAASPTAAIGGPDSSPGSDS
jgi:hypothetical protein